MSGIVWLDALSLALIGVGVGFFLAGSIGLLRLPDLLSRLHALTKADNIGLGCVVLGLMLQAGDAFEVWQLALIWLLVMLAGSLACYLVARSAVAAGAAGELPADAPAHPATDAPDGR